MGGRCVHYIGGVMGGEAWVQWMVNVWASKTMQRVVGVGGLSWRTVEECRQWSTNGSLVGHVASAASAPPVPPPPLLASFQWARAVAVRSELMG
jgi:hypothetical protein